MLAANDSANLRALLEAFPNGSLPKPPSGWWNGITRALSHSDAALRYDGCAPAARLAGAGRANHRHPARNLSKELSNCHRCVWKPPDSLVTHHPEPSQACSPICSNNCRGEHPTHTLTAADVLSRCHLSDVQLLKVLGSQPLRRFFRRRHSCARCGSRHPMRTRWLWSRHSDAQAGRRLATGGTRL
jgi:hypothetical protein